MAPTCYGRPRRICIVQRPRWLLPDPIPDAAFAPREGGVSSFRSGQVDIRQRKQEARAAARALRTRLAGQAPGWAEASLPHLDRVLAGLPAPMVLAGYHPVRDEADVLPLLTA